MNQAARDTSSEYPETKTGASDQKAPFASPAARQPRAPAGEIFHKRRKSNFILVSESDGDGTTDSTTGSAAIETNADAIANSAIIFGS